MQPMQWGTPMWWLCWQYFARFYLRLICQILFEHTFETTQWRKVWSMQCGTPDPHVVALLAMFC